MCSVDEDILGIEEVHFKAKLGLTIVSLSFDRFFNERHLLFKDVSLMIKFTGACESLLCIIFIAFGGSQSQMRLSSDSLLSFAVTCVVVPHNPLLLRAIVQQALYNVILKCP